MRSTQVGRLPLVFGVLVSLGDALGRLIVGRSFVAPVLVPTALVLDDNERPYAFISADPETRVTGVAPALLETHVQIRWSRQNDCTFQRNVQSRADDWAHWGLSCSLTAAQFCPSPRACSRRTSRRRVPRLRKLPTESMAGVLGESSAKPSQGWGLAVLARLAHTSIVYRVTRVQQSMPAART